MRKNNYKQLLKSEIQTCQEKLNKQKDELNTFLCADLKNDFPNKTNGIHQKQNFTDLPLYINNGNNGDNLQDTSKTVLKELIHTCVQYIESQNFLLQGISNWMEISKRYTVEEIDKAYNLIDNTALTIYNNDHLLHIINMLTDNKTKKTSNDNNSKTSSINRKC